MKKYTVNFIRDNFQDVVIETSHVIYKNDVFRINFDHRLSIPIVVIVKEIKDDLIKVDSVEIFNVYESH